jgi:DMSO/TMAO reductase YedYZ molybdopterin-dependent catalytic subunit
MVLEEEATPGIATTSEITLEELQLAARNHGMPLEGLRYPVTPVGMHYLLIHFDIPETDALAWQLDVGGLVERPLSQGMDDLRARPAVTMAVTMECAGNGRARLSPRPLSQPWLNEAVGTAEWTGTPLRPILEEAGLHDDVVDLVFTGADHGIQGGVEQDYERSLSVADATHDEVLLAYEINGAPLPPQHGFPLRLVVPGWYGMTSVKWLRRITAIDRPFDGFQMDAYRLRQEAGGEGVPVTRMLPRALMVPPGFPDFFARTRMLERGPVRLVGRAWSGRAAISRVDVSTDDGATWHEAVLGSSPGPFAWTGWTFEWDAPAGDHMLLARATDEEGAVQPGEQPWNFHGLANNQVQRVSVSVREPSDG